MSDAHDKKAREILGPEHDDDAFWRGIRDQIAAALRESAAAMQERCAGVADEFGNRLREAMVRQNLRQTVESNTYEGVSRDIATAIRELKP